MGKYERWKRVLEEKGLRMNIDKTKGMQFLHGKKVYVSKVDPCGVSGERIGHNSIWCTNIRSGFILVVQRCLGKSVYCHLKMFFCL